MRKHGIAITFLALLVMNGLAPAAAAQQGVLFVEGDRVGVGTPTPDSPLHVRLGDGTAKLHVEEVSGTAQQRELFLLENNGGIRFAFEDTSTGRRVAMRNVNAQFQIDMNNDLAPELRVFANGDLQITGSIITGGGTCSSGCDRVFSPDYELESIEEHAAAMWRDSYLPAVGPTPEGASFNLTEKTGGMLNELEKAHIYIARLHEMVKEKRARLSEVERSNDELRDRQRMLEEALERLQDEVETLSSR